MCALALVSLLVLLLSQWPAAASGTTGGPGATGASGASSLYLSASAPTSGISAKTTIEHEVSSGTVAEVLPLSSNVNDGPMDFVELGFSFPFLGNARVREAGVDPNGMLRFDAFAPLSYALSQSNVVGAFVADLWPGEPVLLDAAVQPAKITMWRDATKRSFSVLWDSRASVPLPSAAPATFALTLHSDGRATVFLEAVPEDKKAALNYMVGMRGPTSMDTPAVAARLSATDVALQETWRSFAPDGTAFEPAVAASYANASLVRSNMRIDFCMVPDKILTTLEPSPICVTLDVDAGPSASPNATLLVGSPDALFGCARAGISLLCRFGGAGPGGADVDSPLLVTSPEGGTDLGIAGVGLVFGEGECALPTTPGFAFNASAVQLVYVQASGEERVVLSEACAAAGGPTLADDLCPPDAGELGEPGVRDCAGQCGGVFRQDSAGACCAFVEPCTGLCSEDQGAFVAASLKRLLQGGVAGSGRGAVETGPTSELVCCQAERVDCDGTCEGCSCSSGSSSSASSSLSSSLSSSSCTCPSSVEDRAGYCGIATPIRDDVGPKSSSPLSIFSNLPAIIILVASVVLLSSVIRILTSFFLHPQTAERNAALAREQAAQAAKKCLTAQQVVQLTQTVVYDEEKRGPQQGDKDRVEGEHILLTNQHHGLCAICISDFEDSDGLRRLPCGHFFHTDCVDPWLLQRSTACPLCKKDVRGADHDEQHDHDHVVINTSSVLPEA